LSGGSVFRNVRRGETDKAWLANPRQVHQVESRIDRWWCGGASRLRGRCQRSRAENRERREKSRCETTGHRISPRARIRQASLPNWTQGDSKGGQTASTPITSHPG